jgi:hypothetical protein
LHDPILVCGWYGAKVIEQKWESNTFLKQFYLTLKYSSPTILPGGNTMTTKIITGKQAQKAIKTIMRKTGWTLSRTAAVLAWPRETLAKIYDGRTINPHQDRLDAISALLTRVEEEV